MTTTAPAPAPALSTATVRRTTARVEVRLPGGWFTVCDLDRLTPGRGAAALLPDGAQVAVFLDRTGTPYVIGNRDPFTGACVLSRGLLGTSNGTPFVASPLLKQRFDLRTGHCLDDDTVTIPAFTARTVG
ncbi:nitrite reductase small subunit NirD [Streptomyces daliensis]|uniref:Nitrite reductase small subunit NirD n=1 Tax=Streptomyces daliensis TaxID=299421 RepID=A0A8T4IZW8_9ACTN|nr:nitrite reductase small subunit NirD [Streptomyces daliensis]